MVFRVRTADRRSSCRAAAGLAGTRESAPAASIGICLLRCLFDVDLGDAGAGTRGASDETLGGPERRPHRWRMSRWGQTVQQGVLFVSSFLRVQ
jgi:hypothetical protein